MTFPEYDIKLAAAFVVDGVKDPAAEMYRIQAATDLILVLIGLDPAKSYRRPAVAGAIKKTIDARGKGKGQAA